MKTNKNRKRNLIITAMFIIFLVLLCSCDAKHCIKYENEKFGNFQYCFDATKSEIEEAPVFTDTEKDKSILGVDMGFLDKISDTLGKYLKPKTMNFKASTYKNQAEPKIVKINRLLNELNRRGKGEDVVKKAFKRFYKRMDIIKNTKKEIPDAKK